jgi:hypothetical protein
MPYTDHFQAINRSLVAIEQELRNAKSQVFELTGNPEEDEKTLEAIRVIVDGNLDASISGLAAYIKVAADELNDEFSN